jgi:type I restriction enzyme S subunit
MVNTLMPDNINDETDFIDLPEDHVKWCTVSLKEVLRANKRLEASVFDIKGKHAREQVCRCKYRNHTLIGDSGFVTAYSCGRFKRIWLPHSELPIYQPSTIMDIKPEPDRYLSRLTNTDIEALKVRRGQILITCSGTIGKITLVSKTLENKIFSHDLIRVNVNNSNDIGYVYAFLRSDIGNILLQSNKYGSVITHIEPEHLADIPVPNPPDNIKKKIHELIMRSFDLRDESNELIDKATALLVNELNLKGKAEPACGELNLPPIHELKTKRFNDKVEVNNFSVKLSNLNGRLDASYHLPIVNTIIQHLKENSEELIVVGDARISKEIILPGRFKRVYVAQGQGRIFFGGKQLFELDPSNKKYLSLIKHSKRIKEQLELEENMVLITCSGTIGKVTLVSKHWNHWTANQHIIRIVPSNNEIAGYLFIFLTSMYGNYLVKRYTYGSVVDEIDENHVSQIPFPLLKNKSIQNQINELALDANRKRYEAYVLEQKAMKILNNEVIYTR